jgi:hypothetical protein
MTESNTTRADVREHYEEAADTDGWVNYGDANPDKHGGIWLRYDDTAGCFEVFRTTPSVDVGFPDVRPEDFGDQYVEYAGLYWSDVVAAYGGWTSEFQAAMSSLTATAQHASPTGAVVDGALEHHVAHEARQWSRPVHVTHGADDVGRIHADTYDDVLAVVGVDPAE